MIIDLSVALNRDTPAYPGDPKINIRQSSSHTSEGYLDHSVLLGTHTGTHVDAPAHMIEDAPTLGQVPIDNFIGEGKIVQGFSKDAVDAVGVAKGDIVLFYTGTSSRYYDSSYFTDYPVLSEEIADYLIEIKIKLVGIDTCSADNVASFPIHKKFLSAGIPIVENLTNLSALQGKPFRFFALPLKLNLDGAPVRAFAEIQNA